jgi:hypothetical protein
LRRYGDECHFACSRRRADRPERCNGKEQRTRKPQWRAQEAEHHKPGAAEQQWPGAEGGDAADGAGQARHPDRHRDHPLDARPITRQKKPSKPNGSATTPMMPAGMIQSDTIGMVSRFVGTP